MPSKSHVKQADSQDLAAARVSEAVVTAPVKAADSSAGGVGETRLTPREAAEALAVLEALRLTRAQQKAGTISVNEVIEQFGIEATPDEVLAALAENHRQRQNVRGQRRTRTPGDIAVLVALSILFCLMVLFVILNTNNEIKANIARRTATLAEPVGAPASRPAKPIGQFGDSLPVIDNSSGHPVSRLMSEVTDGQAVQTQSRSLEEAFSIPLTSNLEQGEQLGWWTVSKQHGRIFIHGYLPMQVSAGIAAQGGLVMTNRTQRPSDVRIGPDPTRVRVPLDKVRSIDASYSTDSREKEGDDRSYTYAGYADDWSRVVLNNLKPGDLQYEKLNAAQQK